MQLLAGVLGLTLAEPPYAADAGQVTAAPLRPSAVTRLGIPGPEAQNLMLGQWTIQVKYEPSAEMPEGNVTTGEEIWRAGPGGRSVIEEYHEKTPSGDMEGLAILWWDADAKGLRILWCSDDGTTGCELLKGVARWHGGSLVYTEETGDNGKRIFRQEIFTDITPSSFRQVLKAGPSVSQLKTTVTIYATKVTRSPQ